MPKEMTFRVKINDMTNKKLFDLVSAYPKNARAELARLAIADYLKIHSGLNKESSQRQMSQSEIDSILD